MGARRAKNIDLAPHIGKPSGRTLLGEGVERGREEIVVGGLLKGAGETQQPRLVSGVADEL